MPDKIDQSPEPSIPGGFDDRAAMAPPVVGLDGEDQQKMTHSPSGQSDRFRSHSFLYANRFKSGALIAAFWRAVTWPAPRTGVKLHPVPVRMPRGLHVS